MKRVFKKKYILVLILLISIGFAYLTSNLSLTGISSIFGNTWDVHFENVQVTSGSVQANTPVISNNDTSVTFTVVLEVPGDFYEFTVDAVNGGTIDAMLDTYTSTTLTEDQQKYLEYTATYADGEALAQYQELNAGDTLTYKIRLYYKLDIQEDDLPSEDTPVEITFTSNFIQADSNRIRRRAENTLYNVLKNEAESGGLAKKYTGAHQDSMDASLSTKDIYHWYATNDTDGTTVTNKNNVIFADHCWQMIRTTDTGGTRLLYNGEAENNQCLNTRGTHVGYELGSSADSRTNLNVSYYYGTDYNYDKVNNLFSLSGDVTTGTILEGQYTCKANSQDSTCTTLYYVDSLYSGSTYYIISLDGNSNYSQFGKLDFNRNCSSLSCVGYMYKNRSDFRQTKNLISTEKMFYGSASLSTSYWYANSATWGSPIANKYNLDNPFQISSTSDYSNLLGKYTFNRNSQSYTDSYVRYIAGIDNTTMYYFLLESGNDLSYYNYTYTYGNSYTDNLDGTYTINNASTLNRSDWYIGYSNIEEGMYVCKNATNNTCSDLWYTISVSNTNMTYIKVADTYFYNDFLWDGSKYVLDNSSTIRILDINNSSTLASLKDAHYTCWNTAGECESVSYIYYINGTDKLLYVNLTNGQDIGDFLNEILYNDDINVTDSTIKTGLDAWYEKYLLNYSDWLEDTIYCHDRSQENADTNVWNPNGGEFSVNLVFNKSRLKCENETDAFSISNSKAKLKYSISLISYPELSILGNRFTRSTNYSYWTLSPSFYHGYNGSFLAYVDSNGFLTSHLVAQRIGVRPAISLKPGTVYLSGDGSMANPYVVTTN